MIRRKIYYQNDPFKLELREEDLDDATLGEKEIFCKTLYSAISPGTELAAFRGDPPLRPGKVYPRLMGYCNAAEVIKAGNAASLKTGDIVITFQSHCSHFRCREEDVVLTMNKTEFKKEYTALYLFHLGYNALLNAGATAGDHVAVIGMGALGITSAYMSEVAGCKTFLLSNRKAPEVLFKNTSVRCLSKQDKQTIQNETSDAGIDIVITTSNTWEDWLTALQLVRKKGTIVSLGFPGRGMPAPTFNPLDSQYFYDKQLTIKSCGYTPEDRYKAEDVRYTLHRNIQYLYFLASHHKIEVSKILMGEKKSTELGKAYQELLDTQQPRLSMLLNWTV